MGLLSGRSLTTGLLAGALVAGAIPPAGAVPGVDFDHATYGAGGSGPPSIHGAGLASGDLDNDGDPDLVVPHYLSGTGPSVMLNDGTGGFTQGETTDVAFGISSVATGNVDRNSDLDVVAVNQDHVYVLSGDGTGGLEETSSNLLLQGGQQAVGLEDVDRDGHLDAIVQLRYGIQVLPGNGDGTFDRGALAGIPSPTLSGFDIANLNADGIPDLVASDAGAQLVYTLIGNGDGTFTAASAGLSGLVPGDVMAADFTSDGIDDVAVINELSPTRNVGLLVSDGSGNLGSPTFYDGGSFPSNGAAGDVNGDAIPDVISSDTVGNSEVVLLGDGEGGLVSGGSFDVVANPQTPVVADLDGDGRNDIVAGGRASTFDPSTTISVLLNAG